LEIERPKHKGLRLLVEKGDRRKIGAEYTQKVSDQVDFLAAMENLDELYSFPHWRVHGLTGDRQGEVSLRVTRNWRLVFTFDAERNLITDLNLVDYH